MPVLVLGWVLWLDYDGLGGGLRRCSVAVLCDGGIGCFAFRSKAVGVSATPGFTKSMQEIHLDKTVRRITSTRPTYPNVSKSLMNELGVFSSASPFNGV